MCEAVPEDGSGTGTDVECVQAPLVESSCQDVSATPEPASVGVSAKVWAPEYVAPDVTSDVVTGAVVSMRNWFDDGVVSELSELSVE